MTVAARPRQNELLVPLLAVLDEHPEGLTAAAAVSEVAARLELEPSHRSATTEVAGRAVNLFARDVRWARQRAKLAGQVDASVRNLWRLTARGAKDLRNAQPGVVITVFETDAGAAIWAEAEAALRVIDEGAVNLWITSPPYDLRCQKAYGGLSGQAYIEWLSSLCREMHRTLADDGSLVLNLGDAFEPGRPVMSLYQERLLLRLVDDLGFRLAQKLVWHNPAKLPAPAAWVTVRRCRVTPATENLYWLAKSDHPKADNRRVLRPYSTDMRELAAAGGQARRARRPSGHVLRAGHFGADHGGSIPHNIIQAGNTASSGAYLRHCRKHGLPVHPARFPEALAEFPIRMLTEPGDLVGDCFAGSCTTASVAERLGRRWIAVERSLTYLRGGAGRFHHAQLATGTEG